MRKLGQKQLTLHLPNRSTPQYPGALQVRLSWASGRLELSIPTTRRRERTGITALLRDLNDAGIAFNDLQTTQSSLEDIFVEPGEAKADELPCRLRDLHFEMARTAAHAPAEHRLAGDLDVALLRRVRRRHRHAHYRHRWRQLRLLSSCLA
jgi:hypothetical protein